MAAVDELERAVQKVADQAGSAVVRIGRERGRGSGVVVGEGTVLTNAHNLRGPETTVSFTDGRQAVGRVQGVDVDGDLAVVAVDTAGATPLEWGDSSSAGLGTAVFALANPLGRAPRVTLGFVSALGRAFRGPRGRRIAGSIEHTAPLGRGSSGGPLVDSTGRLVGINTNRLGDGFYLAIPADAELRSRVDGLTRGESPSRRRLGVGLAPRRAARELRRAVGLPERDGLLVRELESDGPAERAGIRRGDLIVEAQGQAVTSADDLYDVLDALTEDGTLPLLVVRGVEEIRVSVTFGPARSEGSV